MTSADGITDLQYLKGNNDKSAYGGLERPCRGWVNSSLLKMNHPSTANKPFGDELQTAGQGLSTVSTHRLPLEVTI